MGWNSWNTFSEKINKELIHKTADAMVDQGLLVAGYQYLSAAERPERQTGPRPGKIPPRHEGRGGLCSRKGSEIRDVLLLRHADPRRIPRQL